MDLSKLNEVGRLQHILPTKKLSDLDINTTYEVTNLKFLNTKYGEQVVADIEKTFSIFLPARTNHVLRNDTEDLFAKMVESSHNHGLGIRCLGGKYNRLEFVEL